VRTIFVCAMVIVGTCSTAFAEEAKIKSSAAQTAIAKCDKAIADAKRAEEKAEAQALKELVASLEKAKVLATKAGDLPEANALDQKIKQASDRINKPNEPATPKPVQFEVFGNKGWQKMGRLVKGQRLIITVTGQWTDNVKRPELLCGPDGLDGKFRLVAQINGNNSFGVGTESLLPVRQTVQRTEILRCGGRVRACRSLRFGPWGDPKA
jgi:hypothetical protein